MMSRLQKTKFEAPNIFIGVVCIILGSALGVGIIYIASYYFLGDSFSSAMSSAHGIVINSPLESQFTASDQKALGNLVKNGHVLTQSQLIEAMTSFYSGIINILLMVIAVLSALGFLYIKGVSKHEAAEEAKKYANTSAFREEIIDGLEARTSEYIKGMQNSLEELVEQVPADYFESVTIIDELKKDIENIQVQFRLGSQRLNVIEKKIAKDDRTEEGGSDRNIEEG